MIMPPISKPDFKEALGQITIFYVRDDDENRAYTMRSPAWDRAIELFPLDSCSYNLHRVYEVTYYTTAYFEHRVCPNTELLCN